MRAFRTVPASALFHCNSGAPRALVCFEPTRDAACEIAKTCPSDMAPDDVIEQTTQRPKRDAIRSFDEHVGALPGDAEAQRTAKVRQQRRAGAPAQTNLVVQTA